MDNIRLFNEIKEDYNLGKYKETVEKINNYIENKNGIFDYLLDMLMNSLIELGRFSEAHEVLDFISKYYRNRNSVKYLASKYLKCNDVYKAESLLKTEEYDGDVAYNLGKVCILKGKYTEAKKHFLYASSNHLYSSFRNKSRDYLIKLNNYYRLGSYVIRDYKYFKEHGGKLRNGDVVYVDEITDELNSTKVSNDSHISKRPYLVWKIIGKKVYAFPMTLNDNGGYTIMAYRYPNVGVDRYVQDYLVVINEEHIVKIYDHLQLIDFESLLISLYHTFLKKNNSEKEDMAFINSMSRFYANKVAINKIISYYDIENNCLNYYLVIDILDDEYELVKIENLDGKMIITSNLLHFPKSEYIYNIQENNFDKKETYEQIKVKKLHK